jgi:hypothetical protein
LAYELNANEEQVFKMLVEQFGKHEVCAAELVKNNPHVVAAGMEGQLKPLYEQVQQGADAVLAVCLKLDEIDQKAIQAAANFKPQVTDP